MLEGRRRQLGPERIQDDRVELALAAVLVVLSVSAHPTGIVALAPLLVALPAFVRWVRFRPNRVVLATIAIAAVALLGTLVMLYSDFEQRRADATALRTYGDETAGWRDELSRYSQLSQAPYGAALRRGSVALLLLAFANIGERSGQEIV